MWQFKAKAKNRRLGGARNVLKVKLRSSQVRAARLRLVTVGLGVLLGTVFGLYLLWRSGEWMLNRFVYENETFAIRRVDVQTDGVIAPDQLQRWSGVKPGQNLLALDLAHVKRNLELVPMVESASVERVLPATLRIRVIEREPVARVNVPIPRPGGRIEFLVYQLDAEGFVIQPMDPRRSLNPSELSRADDQLPALTGVNVSQLQPGRRIESTQVQAALQLIAQFERSPMAGLADLRSIDVSAPEVLVVTTGQGSEVTFGLDRFDSQLGRWRKVYDECARLNKTIATLDLAVADYTPLRLQDSRADPPPAPRTVKPARTKKRNV